MSDDSPRRTITIDPAHLSSGRKKKIGGARDKSLRSPRVPRVATGKIAKHVRSLHKSRETIPEPTAPPEPVSEFEKAMMVVNSRKNRRRSNRTLKRHNGGAGVQSRPHIGVSVSLPEQFDVGPPALGLQPPPALGRQPSMALGRQPPPELGRQPSEPLYGCIKNGRKPMYREWNRTRKREKGENEDTQGGTNVALGRQPPIAPITPITPITPIAPIASIAPPIASIAPPIASIASIASIAPPIASIAPPTTQPHDPKTSRKTQKKTVYGKMGDGRVGVSVRNNATRKQIRDERLALKRVGIHEVKSYLRDHKLLKYGTAAPNSVMREMYETAILAGDVVNNSSEVMSHNFNSSDDSF